MGAPAVLLTTTVMLYTSAIATAATPAAKAKPPAAPAAPLTLPKGIEVTVEDYDAETETFALELEATPAVGPNLVTPENLRRGIAYPGDLDDFMKQKSQMIGSIYQLKNPTPLVREAEAKRKDVK